MQPSTQSNRGYFGKYREIVLAVAFFLIFDLAVLVMNYVVSYQISADAVSINLGGRQRMLSQRMAKASLDLAQSANSASQQELIETAALFETTLIAFQKGGETKGGDGKILYLAPVTTPGAQAKLAQAAETWRVMKAGMQAVLGGDVSEAARQDAATAAKAGNLVLLKHMNAMTSVIEAVASEKANTLRAIQTGGIILALLNFMFILFKFIRRLRENDAAVELAQRETQEILSTVREGLALVDAEFRLGSQYSKSLALVLGRAVSPGQDVLSLLQTLVDPRTYAAAQDYLELLLTDRVRENLIRELNPLTAVTVFDGPDKSRYLSFQFNRVLEEGKVSHLLMTVLDVTEEIALKKALDASKFEARKEMDWLLGALTVEAGALTLFLNRAEATLLSVNDQLRSLVQERNETHALNRMFRDVHALKGDAAALGLNLFAGLAHDLESVLMVLRDRGTDAVDILSIPLPLDAFLQRISQVRELSKRMQTQPVSSGFTETLPNQFEDLANQVAARQGKQVSVVTDIQAAQQLPPKMQRTIKDICLQWLRNAIVHGIELPLDRMEQGKSTVGNVHIQLEASEDGGYHLRCRDDGAGLCVDKLSEAFIKSGRYSPQYLAELSPQQIAHLIFEPGVSTLTSVSEDAGRGVGLDVVRERVRALGGRLQIASRRGLFTEFTLSFEA